MTNEQILRWVGIIGGGLGILIAVRGLGVGRRRIPSGDGSRSPVRPRLGLVLGGLALFAAALYFAVAGDELLPEPAWQKVTTPDGVCSALMPGTPKANSVGDKEDKNKVQTEEWLLNRGNGEQYIVGYSTSLAFSRTPDEAILERFKESVLATAEKFGKPAHLVLEEEVSGQPYPGRELMVEAGERRLHFRLFVVQGRVYHALCVTGKSDKQQRDARQFLDSVSLVKKEE